jgi:polyhydroxyalkanoate synthesis regulator phasin
MARRRLGGQQITSLLESLPGIASVLRSPVADAIVAMIRAGAGLGDFRDTAAKELVEYAVRRGLIGAQEGEELLAEVKEAAKQIRAAKRAAKKATPKPSAKTAPRAKKIVTSSAPAKAKATKKTTAKKTTAKKKPAKGRKR